MANHSSSLPTQQSIRLLINNTDAVSKYIKKVSIMSKATAYAYSRRLASFENFLSTVFGALTVDKLIRRIKEGDQDVDVLNEYSSYLSNTGISVDTMKQRIITVKNFLEYHDVDISPRRFELKVKLPKSIRKNKEAISKEDITDILNACSDIRLKTYVMLLA